LADNDFWLGLLEDATLRGDDRFAWLDMPAHSERLSSERFRSAARRWLRAGQIVEAWSAPTASAPGQ
jgi:hypothetical protein